MTQTQVMGHLVDKVGISKKEAKLTHFSQTQAESPHGA
jgi:hypothetical protein